MPVVDNTQSIQAGILRDLDATWKQKAPKFEKKVNYLVKFLPYKNLRKATYAWKESLPAPKYWPYGAGRTYQIIKDRKLEVSYYPYEMSIPYNLYDEEDDQIGDLKSHLNLAVDRFGLLPAKFVGEYLNNSASLLPSISTAYDGVVSFSALDGAGNNRFGVSGGNIITGSGAGSVAAFIADLAACQRRFMAFLDTKSERIFDEESTAYTKLVAVVPTSMNAIVQKASKAEYVRSDLANITSETNFVKGEFRYEIDPYLTDTSDWYCFVDHPFWKFFVYRSPSQLRQAFADMNNSDHARNYNEAAIYADVRVGMGPWASFTGIKVNN